MSSARDRLKPPVREIVPLDSGERELVIEAASALAPFEEELALAWKSASERALLPHGGGDVVRDHRAAVRLFLTSLTDGDFGAYFERINANGAALAKTREQYERLVLSFHYFEEATFGHVRKHFKSRLARVLPVLDKLYHNVIAILARAYFRELEMERETYAHVLAHDLRNVLVPVLASASLISGRSRDRGLSSQKLLRISDQIHSGAQAGIKLIDDLLEYGRLKAGHAREFLVIDLVDVSREAARIFMAPFAGAFTLSLNGAALPEDAPAPAVSVAGDRLLLVRAIGNYLSNAFKYASSSVSMSIAETDSGVVVKVIDDGPGVQAEHLELVFEDYFRVPGAKPGTGLGLPSVRMIASTHGGRAWAESRPGAGGIFCLSLPKHGQR